ncbi:hypothetical protein BDF19DRAFT_415439 [Syncephalis fuscata]|nr:hypothetical protein BDF19DRAFT_415439 [Syncephalis fuscata]
MQQKVFDIKTETDALLRQLYTRNAYSSSSSSGSTTVSGGPGQAIIIDYGSYECKAGWSGETNPQTCFPTVIAKYRDRRLSPKNLILVGADVAAHPQTRPIARSPFDDGIVCNSEYMASHHHVDHPLLLTEPICTPSGSRKIMSELAFECYGVPSVSYGIDAMFSYYQNGHSMKKDGIICSMGHAATHILPIVGGRGLFNSCKRLSFGGRDAEDFMLKLMQSKYPTFPSRMSSFQARSLVYNHTYERKYADETTFHELNHTIQFPYTSVKAAEEKTEEELAAATERRRAHLVRLQELAAKSRQEKNEARELELQRLQNIRETCYGLDDDDLEALLADNQFDTIDDLDIAINTMDQAVKRALARKGDGSNTETASMATLPPEFPLLDIPTDQLTEEEKKEQKKQRLMKANYDARERLRRQKEEDAQRKADRLRQEEEHRETDLDGWLDSLRTRWQSMWDKAEEVRKEKEQLGDRRSQASRKRMQVIAELASENTKRHVVRQKTFLDDFGMNDEDWNVYHDISKEEEPEDEEDQEELELLESFLTEHDPNFLDHHKNKQTWSDKSPLLRRFFWADAQDGSTERAHQLQLNVERIRVPEVFFQPSIMGIDQAGIGELLEDLFRTHSNASSLFETVFLTGGMAQLPNLSRRLQTTLTGLLPVGTSHQVQLAADPILDAWRGAAQWVRTDPTAFAQASISRAQYDECGSDYLITSPFSNPYFAS